MKKLLPILLFVLLASNAHAQYQNWAVGFRIGEPTGVNARKYFGTNHAIDVNIGTYGGLYGTNRDYRSGKYKSVGVSFQANYLLHTELFNKPELRGYVGVGGQVNVRNYYPDNLSNQPVNNVSETSLGACGIAGLEYFIPSKPYSVFLETGLYLELLPVPFYAGVQTGLGIRFNF